MAAPEVSIIIPVLNRIELTEKCLNAIDGHTPHQLIEVIVIDNASTDGTHERLRRRRSPYHLRTIRNETNAGFAAANNQGAQIAQAEFLLFLNNDTEVQANWLPPLLETCRLHDHVGAVGARLLFPDGSIQHAGVAFVKDTIRSVEIQPCHVGYKKPDHPQYETVARVPAVTGACMLVPNSAYMQVGGMDEGYWNGYEDLDLCFKLLDQGYHIYYQGHSRILHHESQSGIERYARSAANIERLHRKWADRYTCRDRLVEPGIWVTNDGTTIVIVTHNSQRTIDRCLHRLGATLRDHDEVVIVDNASEDRTLDVIQRHAGQDTRIQVLKNRLNAGYAAAANQGARAGRNPYIVLLNHSALVTPEWIERMVAHLAPFKVAAVGPLTDDVKGLQYLGRYLNPKHLAPAEADDPSEALYRRYAGQSFTTHLLSGFCMMIERKVFDRLGGMDERIFSGSDDLELSWRLRQNGYDIVIAKDTIVFQGKEASACPKLDALTNRLVQQSADYLAYKLLAYYGHGNVPSAEELWSIDWFAPSVRFNAFRPLTSMVLLTFNQLEYTRRCIDSIFRHTRVPFELIVVDNGSTDGSVDFLQSLDRTGSACVRLEVIANPTNTGFANGCNQAIARAHGNYILLINNDTVVTAGWLRRLIDAADGEPRIGLAGPMTNCVSGPQQIDTAPYNTRSLDGLDRFADDLARRHAGSTTRNWRLAGFCLLIKRCVMDTIGGLDPVYEIGNFEDDDYCVRAHLAGYRGIIVHDCFVHHYGSQTFHGNRIDFNRQLEMNWRRFKRKWGIAPDTPYQQTYHIPLPAGGFDKTRHYVAIDQASPVSGLDQIRDGTIRPTHESNPSAAKNRQPLPDPKERFHQGNPLTGGLQMSIIDDVYAGVVKHFAPELKNEAAWILERIVEADPDHSDAHHELGLLAYELGDHPKAQLHLTQAAELNAKSVRFLKDLGDFQHVVNKDARSAQKYYEQAVELDPTDLKLLMTLAHLYTTQQKFAQAATYYRKVIELDPSDSQAAACLEKIEHHVGAPSSDGTDQDLYMQAQAKVNAGDTCGAMADLERLLAEYPDHALAHNDFGVLAYERGERKRALGHYSKAVTLEPNNITFLKNLADYHWIEDRNPKAAFECYIRVLQSHPQDVETLINCGQICRSLGRNDDAGDFFDRALSIDPGNNAARQLKEALQAPEQSDDCPCDREKLYGNAQAKAAAGDIDGAIAGLTELVAQCPEDASAYNDLGVLHYESGHREKALSCYRHAVALAPADPTYMKNLADFYLMEQGRAEEAMKLYVRVLESNPLDIDSLFAAGVVCAKLEKNEDARSFFQRVLEIDPNHAAARHAMTQQTENTPPRFQKTSVSIAGHASPHEATGSSV